jgi:hypothetical protein
MDLVLRYREVGPVKDSEIREFARLRTAPTAFVEGDPRGTCREEP